jgi:hypothetical protein
MTNNTLVYLTVLHQKLQQEVSDLELLLKHYNDGNEHNQENAKIITEQHIENITLRLEIFRHQVKVWPTSLVCMYNLITEELGD